jgi:glycerate kinase
MGREESSQDLEAKYVIIGSKAYIDLESFSGTKFTQGSKYKPQLSSSHSLGQVLKHLYERKGIKNVVIGGSDCCF